MRQSTISSLLSQGIPASLIVVERKVADLPHLSTEMFKMPNRRVDILCYEGETLKPYLLVECKAKSFSNKELRQLLGYNFYIGAPFIALSAPEKIQFYTANGDIISNFLLK